MLFVLKFIYMLSLGAYVVIRCSPKKWARSLNGLWHDLWFILGVHLVSVANVEDFLVQLLMIWIFLVVGLAIGWHVLVW